MTWTYTSPPETPKDWVRFWLGDVDEENPVGGVDTEFFTDEVILSTLPEWNDNVFLTGAALADSRANSLAEQFNMSTGGNSFSLQQQFQNWKQTAKDLRNLNLSVASSTGSGQSATPLPYVGGISISDSADLYSNRDAPNPLFSIYQS